MCIVLRGQDGVIEQARRQLEDLVPVWAVLDYTQTPTIERELLLAKLSILGPEFAQDQLSGSPTHADSASFDAAIEHQDVSHPPGFVPESGSTSTSTSSEGDKIARENALARSFESAGSPLYPTRPQGGMSASEALIAKNLHLSAIKTLVDQFGGRVVDVAESSCIVEVTAKSSRVDAFLALMRPFGVLEAARSGESRSQLSSCCGHSQVQVSWSCPERLCLDMERKKKWPQRQKRSTSARSLQDRPSFVLEETYRAFPLSCWPIIWVLPCLCNIANHSSFHGSFVSTNRCIETT